MMDSTRDIIRVYSDWYEQLSGSPQLTFTDLGKLRQRLASDGAYVIWLRLKEEPRRLCLKIGKAQRVTGGLHARLYEHWHSREPPNVLAKHLMLDHELAKRTSMDLTNRAERKRLLADCCTFQAQPFGFSMAPREVAILECFLTIQLLPRYVGTCGGYPHLPDAEVEGSCREA